MGLSGSQEVPVISRCLRDLGPHVPCPVGFLHAKSNRCPCRREQGASQPGLEPRDVQLRDESPDTKAQGTLCWWMFVCLST